MPEFIPFAAYTRDRSNALGFQFEFVCGRCGNGYTSTFRALSSLSADAGGAAIKKAGGLLGRAGGLFGAAGDFVGDKAADALKDNAREAALNSAIQEIAPYFAQCPRCRRSVCRPVCFNAAAGLCQDCALQVGAAAPSVPLDPAARPMQPPAGRGPAPWPAPPASPPMPADGMPPYPAPPSQPLPAGAPPSTPYGRPYAPPYGPPAMPYGGPYAPPAT